jgi:hypothetical protein
MWYYVFEYWYENDSRFVELRWCGQDMRYSQCCCPAPVEKYEVWLKGVKLCADTKYELFDLLIKELGV